MQEVHDFLKDCKAYYLATLDNGRPRVRPFGTIHMYEDKLYIQTGKVKDVSKQMAADPRVEICACRGGDEWIRIEATVVDDPRLEVKESLLDAYPELKQMYSADDGNTQVLYLTDATATFCSFTTEPRTVRF
jgi:uncharacterized pyridoxamine 5'-phosphate oxidase family protein